MNGQRKRRKVVGDSSNGDHDQEEASRTNQTLPVAELPPDFDGVPLDGAQYLALVRQESEIAPSVTFVVNPYARGEMEARLQQNGTHGEKSIASMPSQEWREQFLARFNNMRDTLSHRSSSSAITYPETLPRGRNGKRWYRFLHGKGLLVNVEYDDDEQDAEDGESTRAAEEDMLQCRDPSETLLHQFSMSQIMTLLSLMPYWFTQPHIPPNQDKGNAIDPFHSRWLFALLAHLDEQLVGDDVSVLRTLTRACFACIAKSRLKKGVRDRDENMRDEMGAWMIICLVVGIWGQHDLWDDGRRDLEHCLEMQQATSP